MKYLWCNNMFSNWHTNRAVFHLLRIKGRGLAVINGAILPEQIVWYHAYYVGTTEKKKGRKRGGGGRGVDDPSD